MIANGVKPDVIVVGMPSCGKTVFFTVLGKKFTNLVSGRRGAPLGFRMGTCDGETAKVVNVAYDKLKSGSWPKPTQPGQMKNTSLRWEVFTGRRRIFELSSMDVSGETFKKAFGIKDDDTGHGGTTSSPPKSNNRQLADVDDELYSVASSETRSFSASDKETKLEAEAEMLRSAIDTAKAVCFMVNVALPERRGEKLDATDVIKLQRFRSAVLNIYLTLRERPELREKSMIVLTQAHLRKGEIERAGGPVMFLSDICGGEASELCNLAKENDIPMLAVSAINEDGRGGNKLPKIESPEDIPSSGLFGFMLVVSGMAAHDDRLVAVKDAYLDYQRDRVEYLRCPSQTIKLRLAQAKKYRKSADVFVSACDEYLSIPQNLSGSRSDTAVSPADVENYRRFTKCEPEVKAAMAREYLVRDELWDRALRRAVVASKGRGADAKAILDEVRDGLARAFPEKSGNEDNEEFIYGFGEEDLFQGSEASTFGGWIALNLREYEKDFGDALDDLRTSKDEVLKAISELSGHAGEDDFGRCFAKVERLHGEFASKMAAIGKDWLLDGALEHSSVQRIEGEVAGKFSDIEKSKIEHERILAGREKAAVAEKNRKAAARRRRRVVVTIVLAVVLVAAGYSFARFFYDRNNKNLVKRIDALVSESAYDDAQRLYMSMATSRLLGIERSDYLSAEFPERLELAKRLKDASEQAEAAMKKLAPLKEWLDNVSDEDVSDEKISGVRSNCVASVRGFIALPPSPTFEEVEDIGVDINARIAAANVSTANLASSTEELGSLKKRWQEHLRHREFSAAVKVSEKLFATIRSELDGLDMGAILKRKEDIAANIENLRGMKGEDGYDDSCRFVEVNGAAKELLSALDGRYSGLRTAAFDSLVADVRAAIASDSASQTRKAFDAVSAFAANDNERTQAASLLAEVEEFEQKRRAAEFSTLVADVRAACASNSASNVKNAFYAVSAFAATDDERAQVEALLVEVDAFERKMRASDFADLVANVRAAIAANSVGNAWKAFDTVAAFASTNDERSQVAALKGEIKKFMIKSYGGMVAKTEKEIAALHAESSVSQSMVDSIAKYTTRMDNICSSLRKRIPEGGDEVERIVDRANEAKTKFPVIVQINAVRGKSRKPVDATSRDEGVFNGKDPDTGKSCVYWLVKPGMAADSSRFVRLTVDGKSYGMSIFLSRLGPGINRQERLIDR